MFKSFINEFFTVVGGLVQSYYKCHTELLENRNVVIGREGAISVCYIERAREGDELAGEDPIEVTVFNTLKVLIFLHIKFAIIIPSESNGVLQAEERVDDGVLIRAGAHRSVSEGDKLVVVAGETGPSVFSTALEHDDHEAAHEEGSVGLLGKVNRRVVVDFIV